MNNHGIGFAAGQSMALNEALAALEAQVAREIALTAHPRMDWMTPRLREGRPALDVLIVGQSLLAYDVKQPNSTGVASPPTSGRR